MMSSPPPLLCPTCLHLSSVPVSLPCGHAFCRTCLQTIDQGLDRHCCPQCRQEYHPNYYHSYNYSSDYCKDYSDMKYPGMSHFSIQNMSEVTKNAQGAAAEMAGEGSYGFLNKIPLNDQEDCFISNWEQARTSQKVDKLNMGGMGATNIDQNISAFKVKNQQDGQEEAERKEVSGFQDMDVKGMSRLQNKTFSDCQKAAEIVAGNDGFQNKGSIITISGPGNVKFNHNNFKAEEEMKSCVYQNTTAPVVHDTSKTGSFRINQHNVIVADIGEMKEGTAGFERKGSGEFQDKVPAAKDSELYNYLKSKVVEPGLESEGFQNKTPLLTTLKADAQNQNSSSRNIEIIVGQGTGMEEPGSCEFQNNMTLLRLNKKENESMGNDQQNLIAHPEGGDMESKENPAFQNKSPISEEDERKMAESKLKLSSQVPDLTNKLEKAEMVLKKEQEHELTVMAANANLRENALKLLGEVTSFAQNYSETIMALIERKFSPGEEIIHKKVEKASGISNQIKKTMQEVDNLLKEKNANVFKSKILSLESEIKRCEEIQHPEETQEFNFDLSKLCPELERLNCEFRDKLGQVQRSLRNEFNPSEVTFDPETLHPNLILSEDLKTVTFSAKKQPYYTTPKRFTNFIQVLSAQSFSAGVHRWEVDVDSAPWLLGVCVASSVPRSGLPSALETSPSSWALMWNQSVLSAFDRSKATQLQKTPQVARKMELKLDCDRGQLDFYYLSETTGRRHIHSFKVETKEPLHLAYRMLSGDPKGRATICS